MVGFEGWATGMLMAMNVVFSRVIVVVCSAAIYELCALEVGIRDNIISLVISLDAYMSCHRRDVTNVMDIGLRSRANSLEKRDFLRR